MKPEPVTDCGSQRIIDSDLPFVAALMVPLLLRFHLYYPVYYQRDSTTGRHWCRRLKLRSERQFSEGLDAKFEPRLARFAVTSGGFGSMSGCYGRQSDPSGM